MYRLFIILSVISSVVQGNCNCFKCPLQQQQQQNYHQHETQNYQQPQQQERIQSQQNQYQPKQQIPEQQNSNSFNYLKSPTPPPTPPNIYIPYPRISIQDHTKYNHDEINKQNYGITHSLYNPRVADPVLLQFQNTLPKHNLYMGMQNVDPKMKLVTHDNVHLFQESSGSFFDNSDDMKMDSDSSSSTSSSSSSSSESKQVVYVLPSKKSKRKNRNKNLSSISEDSHSWSESDTVEKSDSSSESIESTEEIISNKSEVESVQKNDSINEINRKKYEQKLKILSILQKIAGKYSDYTKMYSNNGTLITQESQENRITEK